MIIAAVGVQRGQFSLAPHLRPAGPFHAVGTHADAVAERASVLPHEVQVAVGRVDHDGAGPLRGVVGDLSPEKLRIDGRDVGGREGKLLVRLRSVHGDVGRMRRLEIGLLRRLRRDAARQCQGQHHDADHRKVHGGILAREDTERRHGTGLLFDGRLRGWHPRTRVRPLRRTAP